MPPYKTPEWCARARREWLKDQSCILCGHRGPALSVVRVADSPPLGWTLKGPSHHQINVVCSDGGSCRKRRTTLGVKPEIVHECRRGICRPPTQKPPSKPPPPLERNELPAEVARYKAAVRRIEAGLAQPDKRPVCPDHGPKNTMIYCGAVRFTCCGRVVAGLEPKVGARRVV